MQGKIDLASATPQEIAHEMAQIKTVWPPAGQLVIEINPDQEWGRTWLPRHLVRIYTQSTLELEPMYVQGEEQSSINILNYVHEGMNTIRLIQLAGLADHMFIVLAKEKPPDMGAIDHEPEMKAEEGEGPWTIEQLLNSFAVTTRTIYS